MEATLKSKEPFNGIKYHLEETLVRFLYPKSIKVLRFCSEIPNSIRSVAHYVTSDAAAAVC